MMIEEAVGMIVLRYVEHVVTVMTVGSADDADNVLESPERSTEDVVNAELELVVLRGW